MGTPYESIDSALRDIANARKLVRAVKTNQVRSSEVTEFIKAVALTWFKNYRPALLPLSQTPEFQSIELNYNLLMSFVDKATTKKRYEDTAKLIAQALSALRTSAAIIGEDPAHNAVDVPPDFTPLVPDKRMREILTQRWQECARCISADAPLAATVMMGGLLETLLLARVNKEPDKRPLIGATTAPKDKSSGKTLPLQDWTLRHYLDVAHELGWITKSAKDVGEVLRDYRNYIHPHKQYSHNISVNLDDAILFWDVSRTISRQLIRR